MLKNDQTCIRQVTYGAHATEVSCEKEHAVDKFEYQLCIVGVHIVSCPNQPGFYKDKSTVVLSSMFQNQMEPIEGQKILRLKRANCLVAGSHCNTVCKPFKKYITHRLCFIYYKT